MLYQQPYVQQLHRFRSFAASKEPQDRYLWNSFHSCACAQFYKSDTWLNEPYAQQLNRVAERACGAPEETLTGRDYYATWGDLVQSIDRELATAV